jgi:hypothetical protein
MLKCIVFFPFKGYKDVNIRNNMLSFASYSVIKAAIIAAANAGYDFFSAMLTAFIIL